MSRGGVARGVLLALVLALAPAAAIAARDAPFDDAAIVRADDPEWFKASFLDLRADLAEARAAGKQGLMILFSTEGCAYCKAFIERSLRDPQIERAVRSRFDTLHLEIFDDAELTDFDGRTMPVKDFARREGAAFSPTLLFYGLDGKRIHQAVGYQSPERFRVLLGYVSGGDHRTLAYRDYLTQRQPAPPRQAGADALAKQPLFARPPLDLDRRRPAAKPLLVLFEEAACDACRTLHEVVLRDPAVRALLPRFVAVQLDAGDTASRVVLPDGRRAAPARWARELDLAHLPALVFFDEAGREVLRIDAIAYRQRVMRALEFVLDRAYLRGIPFQRYTREKTLGRLGSGQ